MSDAPRLARVLVAIDASPLSLTALEAAATLARSVGAALTGVFVEDVNLSRLAGHPAATSISLVGGLRRDTEHRLLENALKAQVTLARRAFDEVAEELGEGAEFAVRRGRVEAELLAAAEEADLVLVGSYGRVETLTPRRRLGSTARAVVERATRPVLVIRHAAPPTQPVAVLFDGSPAARRALVLAARLAAAAGARLEVITLAGDAATADQREKEARALIAPVAVAIEGLPVATADAGRVAAEAAGHPLSLLVLPETARHLLDVLHCSTVVVP
jgi:nucleotide-binding universal stress UspA family protein